MFYRGIGASGGFAQGRLLFCETSRCSVQKTAPVNAVAEFYRFEAARQSALQHLQRLTQQVRAQAGESAASIFETHRMMLCDPDFLDEISKELRENAQSAEMAVQRTADRFSALLHSTKETYMQERAADILDIANSLLCALQSKPQALPMPKSPVVLAAREFLPSQTVLLPANNMVALVARGGSATSHSAILARAMGIPAVFGLQSAYDELHEGPVLVDGFAGTLTPNPGQGALARLRKQHENCGAKV